MKMPTSLTARVSLLFAGLAAGVLLIAGLLFERAANNHFLEHDREELYGKMELIRDLLRTTTTRDAMAALPLRLHDAVSGHPGIVIMVAAGDGTMLFSIGNAEVVKHLLEGAEIGEPQPVTWSDADNTYRVVANRLALGIPGTQPARVAIAFDVTDDQQFMSEFREFLWFGMAQAALAMGFLGWVAVRAGLAPLHKMSMTMATVSAQQLDKPLPTANVPLELQELAAAFNRMLARLDDSFRRLSEFSSDIAHELRTPVNNLVMQTEVTLSRERDNTEYRAILQSNLEEFERLSRMISDMLFLAKADNKLVVLKREPIDLQAEVTRLFEFYDALAGEHGVRLVHSGTATVSGDRLMIQRALSNLLSNAIRFTPEGMAVTVTMGEDEDWVKVVVANPGPEIPAENLSRIFDRLYRVDPSRREGHTDNIGLGLAITKSIIEMHGGTISAESENGRTWFTITIPLLYAV